MVAVLRLVAVASGRRWIIGLRTVTFAGALTLARRCMVTAVFITTIVRIVIVVVALRNIMVRVVVIIVARAVLLASVVGSVVSLAAVRLIVVRRLVVIISSRRVLGVIRLLVRWRIVRLLIIRVFASVALAAIFTRFLETAFRQIRRLHTCAVVDGGLEAAVGVAHCFAKASLLIFIQLHVVQFIEAVCAGGGRQERGQHEGGFSRLHVDKVYLLAYDLLLKLAVDRA